jgi:hypothetical protein
MGYAVIQTVPEYHPAGDPTRTSTEFIHWIFGTAEDANTHKDDLLLANAAKKGADVTLTVREVEEEPWTAGGLAKEKPVKKEEPQ